MELTKRKFTMEERKQDTKAAISIDEDIMIEDTMPEASSIIGKKCHVQLEEPEIRDGVVFIKGKLLYELLCQGKTGKEIFSFNGAIPFSEEEKLQGSGEEVELYVQVEDFSPELIHGKKVNLRALFTVQVEEMNLQGEEAGTDLMGKVSEVEVLTKKINILELASRKKDTLKIKQEVTLPNNNPDIGQIMWRDVAVRALDYRAKDGKIAISGEIQVFVMYRSESLEGEITYYETTVPFSDYLDAHSSRDGMVTELILLSCENSIVAKEDFDGEMRVLQLEVAMHLSVRLYEEEELEMLEDVYGLDKEIVGIREPMRYQKLLYAGEGKKKIVDEFPYDKGIQPVYGGPIHVQSEAMVEDIKEGEDGIEVDGILELKVLSQEQKEGMPFVLLEGQIPYQYQISLKGNESVPREKVYRICPEVEQISAHFASDGIVEVRAILNFHGYVYEVCQDTSILEIKEVPADRKKKRDMPGICIYYPKEGESVWEIGKKYTMPIETIKEQNHLTRDILHQGEKLLLMKSF